MQHKQSYNLYYRTNSAEKHQFLRNIEDFLSIHLVESSEEEKKRKKNQHFFLMNIIIITCCCFHVKLISLIFLCVTSKRTCYVTWQDHECLHRGALGTICCISPVWKFLTSDAFWVQLCITAMPTVWGCPSKHFCVSGGIRATSCQL